MPPYRFRTRIRDIVFSDEVTPIVVNEFEISAYFESLRLAHDAAFADHIRYTVLKLRNRFLEGWALTGLITPIRDLSVAKLFKEEATTDLEWSMDLMYQSDNYRILAKTASELMKIEREYKKVHAPKHGWHVFDAEAKLEVRQTTNRFVQNKWEIRRIGEDGPIVQLNDQEFDYLLTGNNYPPEILNV